MLDPIATQDELQELVARDPWETNRDEPESPPARDPANDDRKGYELIHGTWVEKKEMGAQSSKVLSRLIGRLQDHVDTHGLGDVFEAECGYQLFPAMPKLIRKPDASFVATGRFPNNLPPAGNVKLAPDFVAEVVSPNDESFALEQKLDEYLRASVRLIWVVYPNTRAVYVHRPDGTGLRKSATETLDGEAVLPGFALPIADLFKGL